MMKFLRSFAALLCLLPSVALADGALPPIGPNTAINIGGAQTKLGAVIAGRPRWQIVATRGKFPFNVEGGGASNYTRFESSLNVYTGRQTTGRIKVLWTNAYAATQGEYFDTPSPTQLESALFIGGGVTIPLTFAGTRNPTLGLGSGIIESDAVGINLAPGSFMQLRSAGIVASGQKVAVAGLPMYQYTAVDSTSTTSQTYGSSSITVPSGGATAGYGFIPLGVIGETNAPQNSFLLWGDSIVQGTPGDPNGENTYGHTGWAERGLINVSGYNVPFINISRSGDSTPGYAAPSSYRRRALFPFATDILFTMSTNDVGNGIAASTPQATILATIQTNHLAIWKAARAAGLRVHVATMTPKTTSTDNWATAANQTVATGYGTSEVRGQFNAWLRTQLAAGNIDGIVDINGTFADPANPDKWITSGTAGYPTTDGLHPTPALAAIGGTMFNAYVAPLPVRPWASFP